MKALMTNGIASKLRKRQRAALQAASKINRLALFDGSGSMSTRDATGIDGMPCSRWDALQQAWTELAPVCKGRLAAYVFSGMTVPVRGSAAGKATALSWQGGSTAMCGAFRAAGRAHRPGRTLLVSDGESTDGDPVPWAVALGCPVDTIFVGTGRGASTLREISAQTGGEFKDMSSGFNVYPFLKAARRMLRLEA